MMTKRLEYFQFLKRLLVLVVSVLTASHVAADKIMLNMGHNTDNYDTNVVSIDGPPRLLEKFPRTIKNVAGGSVTMVCPLQQPHQRQKKQQQKRPTDSTYSNSSTSSWSFLPSANDLMIEWRKNDRLIGIGWSRFQVKHDTLVISKVDMSDMGNYTCVATNGFGSVVSYYLLCIAESSADFDDVVDNPKYNKYCVEDDPNTNNYNDKHSVKKNKGWLTLDEHGAESLVFFGDVLSNKTAPQDSKVELSCRLTSDQDVRIKWFKRLTPIQLKVIRQEQHPSLAFVTSLPLPNSKDHDDYVQLSSDDDASNIYKTFKNPYTIELEHQPGFNTFHSKLKISSVTSREAGLYACQASNRKTVSYQFVHLTVFDPKNDNTFHSTLLFIVTASLLALLLVFVVVCIVRRRRNKSPTLWSRDGKKPSPSNNNYINNNNFLMQQPINSYNNANDYNFYKNSSANDAKNTARRETNFDPQQIIPQNNSLQQQQYFMRPTMSSITSSEVTNSSIQSNSSNNQIMLQQRLLQQQQQQQILQQQQQHIFHQQSVHQHPPLLTQSTEFKKQNAPATFSNFNNIYNNNNNNNYNNSSSSTNKNMQQLQAAHEIQPIHYQFYDEC